MQRPLEIETPYHCEELSLDNGATGIFCLEKDKISLKLVDYHEFIPRDISLNCVLRLENGYFVSLFDNIILSLSNGSATSRIQRSEFISNLALVGREKCPPDFKIKSADFTIPHVDQSVRNQNQVEKITNSKFGDDLQTDIFSIECDHLRLICYYHVSFSFGFRNGPVGIYPRFAIEFKQGITLAQYRIWVQSVVRFFSALVGFQLEAYEIVVSDLNFEEQKTYVKENNRARIFHVYEPERNRDLTKISPKDLWVGYQFGNAHTTDELNRLSECVKIWINREPEWKEATHLLWQSLALDDRIDAERVMMACRWFEAIPGTQAIKSISENDLEEITQSANLVAVSLGYVELEQRIKGSLKCISKESRKEQFIRLQNEVVVAGFGRYFFDLKFSENLKNAMLYRGKAAHGHLEVDRDDELAKFAKAIFAMECLCYLLTIKGLPISPERKKEVRVTILRNYDSMK